MLGGDSISNVACRQYVSASVSYSRALCASVLAPPLPSLCHIFLAEDERLLWMKEICNPSLFKVLSRRRGRFCSDFVPISCIKPRQFWEFKACLTFFLFLNRVQLAFIALPFQSRVGANLFPVDVKGHAVVQEVFFLFFFFLNSCNIILPSIRGQIGKHWNIAVMQW